MPFGDESDETDAGMSNSRAEYEWGVDIFETTNRISENTTRSSKGENTSHGRGHGYYDTAI